MKELGIKEGKWIARANDYGVDVIEEQSGFGIIWFGTESELRDCEYPIELAEAHAILCADAGNTAQKCGLLPSELLQQRDELKEALIDMMWQFAYYGTKNNVAVMHTGGLSALEDAFVALGLSDPIKVADFEAAIKNTEKK